jgi:transcriptional regulator with PAS, ATPase and Fis domain
LANNGTLFLDEIGDMSFYLQSKLLRALQDGTFSPLGSEKEIKSNVWIISATNKNLEDEIQKKNFRSDLFYRLNTINIHIKPLRKRPGDIPLLLKHFFDLYNNQLNRNKEFETEITDEVMELMLEYAWPGNVRELQNVVKRIVVFGCIEETIGFLKHGKETLSKENKTEQRLDDNPIEANTGLETPPIGEIFDIKKKLSLKEIGKMAVEKAERRLILHVLGQTGWNRKKATRILGVSYPALLYKMKDLNICLN